ncbi:MAG: DUF4347 domain-containing protein [Thermoplasmata archaeon]|nr:MAG: DUF4347 domain-containing protein [Thermoplasmata archaeon]
MKYIRKICALVIIGMLVCVNFYTIIQMRDDYSQQESHDVRIEDRFGNTNGHFLLEERDDGKYDLKIWTDSGAEIEILGLEETPSDLLVKVDTEIDDPLVKYVVYVDSVEMERARITLPTYNAVYKIVQSKDFNPDIFTSDEWEDSEITFTQEGDSVTFEVDHFSAYGVAEVQNKFTVSTTDDTGEGSLRQAIYKANAFRGLDLINFDIPADDENHYYYLDDGIPRHVTYLNRKTTSESLDSQITDIDYDYPFSFWSIQPQSALPLITDSVIIDGYTQSGARKNSLYEGNDAILTIEIDGSKAGWEPGGLHIIGGGSTVRGLVVQGFGLCGFQIETNKGSLIEGNYIGTDVSGTLARGNFIGVNIFNSIGNIIGGEEPESTNIIMGNRLLGVLISGDLSKDNVVKGNLLGTDITLISSGADVPSIWVADEISDDNMVQDNFKIEDLSKELIFLDPSIENYASLLRGILYSEDSASTGYRSGNEVYVLDVNRDGIEQISEELTNYHNVAGIHIISHGSMGSLTLGSTDLFSGNIDNYAHQLSLWNPFLTDDADILLYGCNIAEGEQGETFIKKLSEFTKADIAASNDPTGSSELGGDWKLEVTTGLIETTVPFSAEVLEDYNHLLGTDIVEDVPLSNYISGPLITYHIKTSFVNGLGELPTLLDDLSDPGGSLYTELLTAIPGILNLTDDINNSYAPGLHKLLENITLGDLFSETVVDEVNDSLALNDTMNDFENLLEALDTNVQHIRISVDVLDKKLDPISGDEYEMWFRISFRAWQTFNFTLDLGRNADLFGISINLPNMPMVELKTTYTLNLTFGCVLDLTEGNFSGSWDFNDTKIITDNTDFFIRDTTLTANADIHESNIDFDLQIGFLEIEVENGILKIDIDMNATFNDPSNADSKNRITLSELASVTVNVTGGGYLGAHLPVNVKNIPSTSFSSPFSSLSMSINMSADVYDPYVAPTGSDDPRTAPEIELSHDFRQYILPFNNILPDGLLGLLEQLKSWLGTFGVSQLFNAVDVPFADGHTLANVLNFFSGLQSVINNSALAVTDEDTGITITQFTSAQDFMQRLDSILDIDIVKINPHYVLSKKQLMFTIELNRVLPIIEGVPIDFDIDLGDLGGIDTDVEVSLNTTVNLTFTIGIDLSSEPERGINSELAFFGLRALINGSSGTSYTPSDGVLPEDALFKLTIGSLGSIDVNVSAVNTSDNTNIYNLTEDISLAINESLRDEKIDAVITVKVLTGKRLAFFTKNVSFMKIENNSADANESAQGFELLGFADGQIGSTSPTPQNGVISGNATFDLILGSNLYKVNLIQGNTTGNPTTDDPISSLIGNLSLAVQYALGGTSGLLDVKQVGDGFSIIMGATNEKFMHIKNPNDVAFVELGIPKDQIAAELQIIGDRTLLIEGNPLLAAVAGNGQTQRDAYFHLEVDGDPVNVSVRAANGKVIGWVCNLFATGNLTAPNDVSAMAGYDPQVDVTFKLTINDTSYIIFIPKSETDPNTEMDHLLEDINNAFADARTEDGTPIDISSYVYATNITDGDKLKFVPANLTWTLMISSMGTTQDNEGVSDLANDLNEALGRVKLSDGTRLDNIIVVSVLHNETSDEYSLILSVPSALKDELEITYSFGQLGFYPTSDTVFGPRSHGQLSDDATFTLTLDEGSGLESYDVLVDEDWTTSNNNITDLVEDINRAFQSVAPSDGGSNVNISHRVVAGRLSNRITISAVSKDAKLLEITDTKDSIAYDELGLDDGVTARAREKRGRLFIKNASFVAGVNLVVSTTDNPAASARFGFVGIEVDTIEGTLEDHGNDVAIHGDVSVSLGGITSMFELTKFNLSKDAFFEIEYGDDKVPVSLPKSLTLFNTNIGQLASQLWTRINLTSLNGKITVGYIGDRLILSDSGTERIRLIVDPEDTAATELGFATGQQIGPIYLGDLTEAVSDFDILKALVNVDISGNGNLTLSNISIQLPDAIQGLANELLGNPRIVIVLEDFTNMSTLDVTALDMGAIADGFDDLNFSSVLTALRSIYNLLINFSKYDFYDEPIPILGVTLNETLNFIEPFLLAIEELSSEDASIAQELLTLLKEVLGIPTDDEESVILSIFKSSTILRFNITWDTSYSASLPVQIDLLDLLGLSLPPSLQSLANLSGAAGLEAEFSVEVELGMGINLSNFAVYIFDNTEIRLEGYANASNVNFIASLGPFGLFVTGGHAVFNEDGNPSNTNPAYLILTAFDDPNPSTDGDKIELFNLSAYNLKANLSAGIGAILPCYFPTASNFIGNLDFNVNISMEVGTSDPFDIKVDASLNSAPNFTAALPDLDDLNLIEMLLLVVEGLDMLLAILEDILAGEFGEIDLPLIGDSLSDGAEFIEDVRDSVIPWLRDFIENAPQKAIDLVREAIFNALGPPGLDILQLDENWNSTDGGLTFRDVQYYLADDWSELQFNLWLGDRYSWETPEIDFGLPGLGLDMDGGIEIAFTWNFLLVFGISLDDGFYFDTTPWDEFTDEFNGTTVYPHTGSKYLTSIIDIGLGVTLMDHLTGKLLFLQLDVENLDVTQENPDKESLYGWFSVDVEGGGDDDRLSFGEIPSMDFDFSWGVQADLDLDLRLGIVGGGKWPSIEAGFYLRWGLGDGVNNSASSPFDRHPSNPWINFTNVGLNLGSFFSDFLGPIVEEIQQITEPLQPLVDILTSRIPVISDLAGQTITLIDIAGMFGVVDPAFIYALADLITFINSIPTDAGDIVIVFGSFSLGGDDGDAPDLTDEGVFDEIRNTPSSQSLPLGAGFEELSSALSNFDFDSSLGSALDGSSAKPATKSFASSTTKEGGGWSFPIFEDPGQIFGLLLGRPADIVVYDMPKFIFDFTYSQYFPIWDGLGAEITGSLGVIIDLSFGYDTYGLQEFAAGGFKHPLDLLKGFYVGDLDLDTGADIPEVTIYGGISGAAVLNLVVAKAGVGGGIYATIDFNLNDPDGDGKVRIEEIWGNILNGIKQLSFPLGLICIFDVSGKVEARLFAFVEALWGLWEKTWYFGPSLPLIEFSYTCPKDPILAKVDEDSGELRLNMGEFAQDRLYRHTTDDSEKFILELKSGDTVEVTATLGGTTYGPQEYSGVKKVMADCGEGNDIVDMSGVDTSSITAELVGGSGNDVLIAGDGVAELWGGIGEDVLVGGPGNDHLYGEKGEDILIGNGGKDYLEGGSEDDVISGDASQAVSGEPWTLRGSQQADIIFGGAGDDFLAGGDNGDIVRGEDGEDWIWGDSSFQYTVSSYSFSLDTNGNGKPDMYPDNPDFGGQDHITGDADADNISGEGGDDFLSGGGAPDWIHGGGGADTIWGDSSFDYNKTSQEFEENATGHPITRFPLYGTAAGDNLTGGDGNDWIFGEDGNDELHGGANNDWIWGDRGSDIAYGDEGNDDLYGGSGNDRLYGNAGHDLVKGNADNDVMFGDDGEVYLVPNKLTLNYDLIKTVRNTTIGNDFMNGDVGDDILLGGPGQDTMNGGDGDDKLIGDNGEFDFDYQDTMGGSLIELFESTDLGSGDDDTIYGGEGEDIAIGGRGEDDIFGDADELGADGDDILIGDNGRVDFVPVPDDKTSEVTLIETTDTDNSTGGDDYINGSENADVILGGVGDDDLIGGLDNDIILGDSGLLNYNTGDGDRSTLDLILTTDNILPAPGGVDTISGGEVDDTILGGDAGDIIYGDDTLDQDPSSDPGEDIIIGDQGRIDLINGIVVIIEATDTVAEDGGNDTVEGNEESDVIIGGVAGDDLDGATGNDIIVGDEGILKYNLANGSGGDGDPTTLDMINTTKPDLGSGDTIRGDEGEDIVLGGAGGDYIEGNDNDDVILGDNGELTMPGGVIDMIETIFPSYGSNDTIYGQDDDDIILGGTAGDYIWGNDDNDIILGDNGKITMPDEVIQVIETTDPATGGSDIIEGNDDDDKILGGAAGDFIWGNLGNEVILGDNGRLDFVVDGDADTLDLIETTDPSIGGIDTIEGNEGEDTILGGPYGDYIWGHENNDLILGDNGRVTQPGEIIELIETTDPAIGGNDTIEGNDGDDYILGGAEGDLIWGNLNEDVILGDNGFLDMVFDGDANTLDLIVTTDPGIGGSDTIEGNEDNDKILGGAFGDDIWGHGGEDIILGDNGNITQPGELIEKIKTTDPAIGGSDTIEGNDQDDIILGGAYGDHLKGNADMDIILGDNGLLDYVLTSVDSSEPDTSTLDLIIATFPNDGGSDMILCGSENDIAFGGTADDTMYGHEHNDLLFGDHARVERKPNMLLDLSTLPVPTFIFIAIYTAASDGGDGDLMYGNEGDDIMLGQQGDDDMFGNEDDDDMIGGHNVVGGIDELDVGPGLNDIMDGGSEDDVMAGDNCIILRRYDTVSPRIRSLEGTTLYDENDDADVTSTHQPNPSGARGRDTTLLDHSDSPTPYTYGNDYMAGGPHEDVMFGELGDDLMQGDASVSEFINATDPSVENADDGDDYMEGNGGKDLIYGDYGQDDIVGGSSELFGLTDSSLRPDDSDTIFGGAGTRIARYDPGDESDDGHALDSDYILGDNGNIFRIVGTNGQYSGDFLTFTYDNYGNVTIIPRAIQLLDYTPGGSASDIGTDDLIHGEASDDLIHGMVGNDVIFGEGQDDDLYGQSGHDRMYGGNGQDGMMGDDGRIRTSRNGETEPLYGLTKPFKEKFIKLPGPFIGAWVDITGRLKKVADIAAFEYGGNDIMYGGLGNDWMHGGAGDDGMLGAEALPDFYNSDPITNTTPLPYDPVTRKISFYDAENPRTKIVGFFLNFEAVDGNGTKILDGKDRMFGDNGHDWIVGGTQNDRMFGGLGDDVINADDNHDSQGGLNNEPDSPEFADRDFVFGGCGLDVMIFNTGGDRVFDWIGEFNSYIAPYAPFGYPETDRLISPHLVRFLMALGEACGADQALVESDGELGLADQKDDRWGLQHGGPRDPQAGNLPATHRDTMGEPEDDR